MSQFKIQPPVITLKQLDEPPFAVERRENGPFGFIVPELGRESSSTAYEHPGPKFWQRREYKVKRKADIHGVECFEIQEKSYDAAGALISESANFAKIDRGYVRNYAFQLAEGEKIRIYTWKDSGFNQDWGYDPGTPIRIADVGKWRLLDDRRFTDGEPTPTPPEVDANGAGLWEVQIDEAAHRCLRVLTLSNFAEDIDRNTLVESFVDRRGRTMLARRYNGNRWTYGSKRTLIDGKPHEWTEILPDAPRLYYNDICFVLWDFSIPDIALSTGDA